LEVPPTLPGRVIARKEGYFFSGGGYFLRFFSSQVKRGKGEIKAEGLPKK